jgi:hypothetical protein
LGHSQGHVSFLAARVTPESTVSLAIAIMSVLMFDLAMNHNGEGLFLFGWSLLTTPLLMQWKPTINYS